MTDPILWGASACTETSSDPIADIEAAKKSVRGAAYEPDKPPPLHREHHRRICNELAKLGLMAPRGIEIPEWAKIVPYGHLTVELYYHWASLRFQELMFPYEYREELGKPQEEVFM